MALSCGIRSQFLCRSRGESRTTLAPRSSVSFPRDDKCRSLIRVRSSAISAPPMSGSFAPAISLTDEALNHLNTMRSVLKNWSEARWMLWHVLHYGV
ncbi:iron-sulfur assembly protein [Musa troglodytarum]|uniref:Iron-sulfur assembly protein n=1 Tax=Musa troglodytarum TaxID=320322 RepID=A0A9E7JM07_9LILI|nr:iron-sulfur assembly protein [Musa troglodytarum]URD85994.1 iron-sulfur assembly protein [Musa troglodytarum]